MASPWMIEDVSPKEKPTRRLVKQCTLPATLKCSQCDTLVRGTTITPPSHHKGLLTNALTPPSLHKGLTLTPPASHKVGAKTDSQSPISNHKWGGMHTLPANHKTRSQKVPRPPICPSQDPTPPPQADTTSLGILYRIV